MDNHETKQTETRMLARNARRIVVKIGSSVLTDRGKLRQDFFAEIAAQTNQLLCEGREIVIVSSGAVAAGSHVLGWSHPGRSMPEKQAAASVGQIEVMQLYRRSFADYDRHVSQILVTRTDLENRERFINARHTFLELLKLGVIPIVNENDTVATEEIRFGDNDNLSAAIVSVVGADLLILMTDVEGLYHAKPEPGKAKPPLFDEIVKIDDEIRAVACDSGSAYGRGGMITKLEAATKAAHSGAATVICSGAVSQVLLRVAAGERIGTLIRDGERMRSRKHWLAFTARPRGKIVVDAGAARAIVQNGRSLLPAGILRIEGQFGIGDPVSCVDAHGTELARGLSSYSSTEVAKLCGVKAEAIAQLLGYSNGDEVIHRDDLVVTQKSGKSEAATQTVAE